MNHAAANAIFEEIRNRPYAWSVAVGQPANNCYFKGIELLQRLGILGYAVRGRVGETFLDARIPEEIRRLYPRDVLLTHFWVEIEIDGRWQPADPSYDPPLGVAGFPVNDWDSGKTCFEITRAYSQEEAIAYQAEWNDPRYAAEYFAAIGPCAQALNKWFDSVRADARKSDNHEVVPTATPRHT
jgi:hypothetical protein